MANINSSDIIFATAIQHGNTILSLRMSGLSSFADAIKKIRQALTNRFGLVTLKLRNSTQGWSQQHALMFDNTITDTSEQSIQLSLF